MQIQEKATDPFDYQFTVISHMELRIFYFDEHCWKYLKNCLEENDQMGWKHIMLYSTVRGKFFF